MYPKVLPACYLLLASSILPITPPSAHLLLATQAARHVFMVLVAVLLAVVWHSSTGSFPAVREGRDTFPYLHSFIENQMSVCCLEGSTGCVSN